VTPNSIFGVQWTAYMIFMVLLGGLGTFEGPLLGALVLFGIQQELQSSPSWYLVVLGGVAIGVTLLLPRGVWGALVDRFGLRLVPVGYTLRGLARSLAGGARSATAARPAPAAESEVLVAPEDQR
jgi:branched-chain amino acid transport system permease protein